jgi:hypothetical protein
VSINENATITVVYIIQKTKAIMKSGPPKIRIETEVLMTGMQLRN